MIFLDANVMLRYLAPVGSPKGEVMQAHAAQLLESVASGRTEATTSEVVLHEVCFILGSKHHYRLSSDEIIALMRAMFRWPTLQFPADDKPVYLRALALWEQHPKLEFADSVIAARCERAGHQLATFDRHFQDLPSLDLWQPDSAAPGEP